MKISLKRQHLYILGMVISAPLVLSGCETMHPHPHTDAITSGAADASAASSSLQATLDAKNQELMQKNAEIERLQSAMSSSGSSSGSTPRGGLFPPNALPGHCYARVLTPATYKTTDDTVLVSEASERVEIIPAKFEWEEETVIVKEASSYLKVIPATYETVTEQVLVRPESVKLVEVPAKYRTETEQVLDKPAHTVWKKGVGPTDSALQTRLDQSTGELMCLVEVPATYRTITRKVLAQAAGTKEVIIPAKYKTIKKTVLKTPATTKEIQVPAKYGKVKKQKIVSPASEKRIEIPAKYSKVSKREKITEEKLAWEEVLCKTNMTKGLVSKLQTKLKSSGHYKGPIDGVFGGMTIRGVNSYARSNNLPTGTNYVTIETAKQLGIM